MFKSQTVKVIESHLLEMPDSYELLKKGQSLKLKVDQTLTQDSTGTMVYLQLEAMNVSKIQTELSVAYVDHNMLQSGFENADDHAFIESVAKKYGLIYSKPGNGICHQLHLENFAVPGKLLIGSDSHTPTCGGMGMLAVGAGGLDVAIGMAKGVYHLAMPSVIQIELKGSLKPWVSAKDIILKVLQMLGVSGGVNAVLEYTGEGVKSLSVPERATITNMGAELGATSSLFPSDENTLDFLRRQGREMDYSPLSADEGAKYDDSYVIDLDQLEPLIAKPHSPDAVVLLSDVAGISVDQVAIGSCTNASYADLMKVAKILKGKAVHPQVSLVISPGSSAILKMLAENGALADLIGAGARLLEAGCGPCIGMGQSPKSGAVSLRTFNRNFVGRSGTLDAQVYLLSPEAAAASALTGVITDPRTLGIPTYVEEPALYAKSENYWIRSENLLEPMLETKVMMGPNIKPFPVGEPLSDALEVAISLKTGDKISTDDIMPSHAGLLPFRSNVPRLSMDCFVGVDPTFSDRAKEMHRSAIIGGHTYGQGSSREHAALVPLYLGVRVVIAKSFARIHRSNLINAGILPLTFADETDYALLQEGAMISLEKIHEGLEKGHLSMQADVGTSGHLKRSVVLEFDGTQREIEILKAGGALKHALL